MICRICNKFINQNFDVSQLLAWGVINDVALCQSCCDKFTLIDNICCPRCGRQQKKIEICMDCQRWQQSNEDLTNQSLYQYNTQMQIFMKLYKYQYDFELATIFKSKFTQFLRQGDADIYIAIPVKQTKRQFNQVRALTKGIKFLSILTLNPDEIGHSQAQRNRQQRMIGKQPFVVDFKLSAQVKNKRVMLVDDIYTTGATLHHAAKLIAQCEPLEISARTLCR